MNDLTLNEVLRFFSTLDLKSKIAMLHELTSILNTDAKESSPNSSESDIIDELFGVWKEEDTLTEQAIIDRTISHREINLN